MMNIITFVLTVLIDFKTFLQGIDLSSVLGVVWVGPDLTLYDIFLALFVSGSIVAIFGGLVEDEEE